MKKILTFLFVLGSCIAANAERCGCGEKKYGITIEYSVFGSGERGSKCCDIGLVTTVGGAEPAISMS